MFRPLLYRAHRAYKYGDSAQDVGRICKVYLRCKHNYLKKGDLNLEGTSASSRMENVELPNKIVNEALGTPQSNSGWSDGQFLEEGYKAVINKAKNIVKDDFRRFKRRISEETAIDDPILHAVCNHYFDRCGKQFRPIIVLVISRILNEIAIRSNSDLATKDSSACTENNSAENAPPRRAMRNQIEVATISELIHVSSIMHDDVIDGASLRRMIASTNYKFGNKLSILGGDLLFSRASVCLSKIESCRVVGIISSIIQSLVEGEVLQMQSSSGVTSLYAMYGRRFNISKVRFSENHELDMHFNLYLERSYLKTASLLCKSALAAAVLSGSPPGVVESVLAYTKNVGLAFQMYDDISNFDSLVCNIGKPVGSDLKNGLATLPVLFAAKSNRKLLTIIARGFSEPNDVDMTIEMINSSDSIEKSKQFALQYCENARKAVDCFPDIPETEILREFTYAVQGHSQAVPAACYLEKPSVQCKV